MVKMLNEILEQPRVVKKIIDFEFKNIETIASVIKNNDIRIINIAARGTSDNAAVLGKYLFEYLTGIPTSLFSPSLFTLYKAKINLKNSLLIGISQSGEATDVGEVIRQGKKQKAITLGITNTRGSTLTKISDYFIYIHAKEERSLAATKTYIGQITVLYLLSALIKEDHKLIEEIFHLPPIMQDILDKLKNEIPSRCERYRFMERCIVLGRGFNFATALETALKLKETSYCLSEPFSAADFLHGPIVIVEAGFPVIIYAPSGKTFKMMKKTAGKLKRKKAELIIISDNDDILKYADLPVKINYILPEILTPLIYILFGQIFAFYLSQAKKLPTDQPRYLKKITKTK